MRTDKVFVFVAMLAMAAVAANAAGPSTTGSVPHGDPVVRPLGGLLYDQNNNLGANATNSQNFETGNDAFDNSVGDDFVVPVTETWLVNEVFVDGVYFNGPGPAASVNVWIYPDVGGLPGPVAAFTYMNAAYTGTGGDFSIALSPVATLLSGTYWLVVQANQDFSPFGQWGWLDRTVVSNNPAVWQNPNGGFGTPCTSWGRRGADCGIDPAAPDQVFQILGTLATVGVEPMSWGIVKTLYTN